MEAPRVAASRAAASTKPARRRSAIACLKCSSRRVRCNVASVGQPCANCQHDGLDCCVVPRSSKSHGRSQNSPRKRPLPESSVQQHPDGAPRIGHGPAFRSSPRSPELAPAPSRLPASSPAEKLPNITSHPHSDNLSPILLLDEPGQSPASTYIGDQQGSRRFISVLCNDSASPSLHRSELATTASAARSQANTYLKSRGAFDFPDPKVCDALIRCYFRYVHFFMPVVNAKTVLLIHLEQDRSSMSPLLLWSIFLAAANFVEPHVISDAGFESRTDMKSEMFQKAKCLYNMDHETDKITSIQSLILMSLWYADSSTGQGASYWIGIAIGLCHSLGFHHDIAPGSPLDPSEQQRVELYRRIWWTCFARDRWLSLSIGNPLIIDLDDTTVLRPTTEDVLDELQDIPPQLREQYFSEGACSLVQCWLSFVKLSEVLGDIIRALYRRKRVHPTVFAIESFERQLDCIKPNLTGVDPADPLTRLSEYQYMIFYEATVIILHRPFVLRSHVDEGVPAEQHERSRAKAQIAAINVNTALEKVLTMEMLQFLKPMTIAALVPAMQMHLLEAMECSSLPKTLAVHRLDLCMIALSELRDIYAGAADASELFDRARKQLILQADEKATTEQNRRQEQALPSPSASISHDKIDDTTDGLRDILDPDFYLWNPSNLLTTSNGASEEWQQSWASPFDGMGL